MLTMLECGGTHDIHMLVLTLDLFHLHLLRLIYFVSLSFTFVLSQQFIGRALQARIHRFHLPNPLVATLQIPCFIPSSLFACPAALVMSRCARARAAPSFNFTKLTLY